VLRKVLDDEVARGRIVALEDGCYQLRPGLLPPEVTRALRVLAAPETAAIRNGHNRRRSSGRLSATERAEHGLDGLQLGA
jgi:hypothetical protein